MATTNIISRTNIDSGWVLYSLGTNIGAYLIAIKDPKTATDTFDINELKYITMDIGIDSGIKDKPITISRVKLNFNEETSSDADLNKKTAMTKVSQLPTDIYLRITSFADSVKEYKVGSMPVSINIAPFK